MTNDVFLDTQKVFTGEVSTIAVNGGIVYRKSSGAYDNFEGALWTMTTDGQSSPNGKWKSSYLGYGFAKTVTENGANILQLSPKLDVLRAAKLKANQFSQKTIHGKFRCRLDKQSTSNTQPWYTIWPLIAEVNDTTHYYFNLKTNGWELGKKDNDHPASEELQEYLATGSSPKAVIGVWNTIEWWVTIENNNMRIKVDVNGSTVVNMLDNKGWQRNGTSGIGASQFFINALKTVALYAEGSQVSWDNVELSA